MLVSHSTLSCLWWIYAGELTLTINCKFWSMTNTRGEHLFKLKVLLHDEIQTASCRYWIFRSWGRIGTTIGGTKLEHLGKEACIDKFEVKSSTKHYKIPCCQFISCRNCSEKKLEMISTPKASPNDLTSSTPWRLTMDRCFPVFSSELLVNCFYRKLKRPNSCLRPEMPARIPSWRELFRI